MTINRQKLAARILMVLLACIAAGCGSDLPQDAAPSLPGGGTGFKVTATAGMPQAKPATRLAFDDKSDDAHLLITWKKTDESFSVLKATDAAPATFGQTGINAKDAHKATFEGTIAGKEGDFYALYPALPAPNATASATDVTLDMTGQTGTEMDESKTYMYGKSTYSTPASLNFDFRHLTSIVKVTMQFPAETRGQTPNMEKTPLPTTRSLSGATMSGVTFSAEGLKTQAHADITQDTPAYSNETADALRLDGSFTLSADAAPKATVYLHVLPDRLTDFMVSAMVGGKAYAGTVSADCTIEGGKMYTATVDMSEMVTVTTTVAASASYDYNGLTMQIGSWDVSNPAKQTTLGSAVISDGKAVIPVDLSAYRDKAVWVCIPGVVKFFHTLTADEASGKALTLPDKDGGSTLKASPTAGSSKYENDWIVALYIGINRNGAATADIGDGAIPIYWATGGLIATKTNDANSGTTIPAFHIATAEETKQEGIRGADAKLYNDSAPATEDATDGYSACALGSQWNLFGWGDPTGLKTSKESRDYATSVTVGTSISGTEHDIARVGLGGSWRLPMSGDKYNGKEFTALADGKDDNLPPDGENWTEGPTYLGRTYSHTIENAGHANNTITNTLSFPARGYRTGKKMYYSCSSFYCDIATETDLHYWFFNSSGTGHGWGGYDWGRSVRPVSE